MLVAQMACANVVTVKNLQDSGPDSLRAAIVATGPGGVIVFAPGLSGWISLTSGQLQIGRTVTIMGPGKKALVLSGNNSGRVLTVADGQVQLIGLAIVSGSTNADGGGIYNSGTLTLRDCEIHHNSTQYNPKGSRGGGIYNKGTLRLDRCEVHENSSTGDGGGLYNDGGTVIAERSVFYSNGAESFVTLGGGGITTMNGSLTVNACTFNLNSCGQHGAAISSYGTTLTVLSTTVSANDAAGYAGGIYQHQGTATIGNTIVADNIGHFGSPDIRGDFMSEGFNLIGKSDGSTGWIGSDQAGTVAFPLTASLDELRDNGGPTPTLAPFSYSPALDQGKVLGLRLDQRGLSRPFDDPNIINAGDGDGNDIGAYEANAQAPTWHWANPSAGLDGRWENTTNWLNGQLPDLARNTYVNASSTNRIIIDGRLLNPQGFLSVCNLVVGGNSILLRDTTNGPFRVQETLDLSDGAALTVTNAVLAVGGIAHIGASGSATFSLLSGAANVGDLDIADDDSVGEINLAGGTLSVGGNLVIAPGSNSVGSLTISGGMTLCTNIVVGAEHPSSFGTVSVTGGSLLVTNAAHTAVLEVRNGKFEIHDGLVVIDNLIVTNSNAQFRRTGGSLTYGTLTLDPEMDPDGDGVRTADEYVAGTDPIDPGSYLHMVGITPVPGGIRVQWRGGTWVTQILQQRTTLDPNGPPWQSIFTNMPPTPNPSFFVTDPSQTNSVVFYRILIQGP
jgi:hypothetical protein